MRGFAAELLRREILFQRGQPDAIPAMIEAWVNLDLCVLRKTIIAQLCSAKVPVAAGSGQPSHVGRADSSQFGRARALMLP